LVADPTLQESPEVSRSPSEVPSRLTTTDMEQESLKRLDLVLGCFHSALRKKEDQTERYLAALRNPDIQILGHPRGRIYNYRLGLTADWARIFDMAAQMDKAVEIDAYPDRQDVLAANNPGGTLPRRDLSHIRYGRMVFECRMPTRNSVRRPRNTSS